MTGFERHFEGELEKTSRSVVLPAGEGIVCAWILENVDQHGSERARALRTRGNHLVDRARVEAVGAGPGVNLLTAGYGDFQPHSVFHIERKVTVLAEFTAAARACWTFGHQVRAQFFSGSE